MKERVFFVFFSVALTQPRIYEFFLTSGKTHRIRDVNNTSVLLLFLYIPTLRATSYLLSSFTAPNSFLFFPLLLKHPG